MKTFRNLVASAATAMLMVSPLVATPAFARDNSAWNAPTADAQASLIAGMSTCFGDQKKKMHTVCSVYDSVNRLMATLVTMRGPGVIKNLSTIIISPTDENGNVLRDESGRPIVLAAHVAEQTGGKAILAQGLATLPSAIFNGVAAAGINAAFPACGSNCGQGPGVINLVSAVSGSNSNAAANVQAALGGGGTCPTGNCPAPPRPHGQ